MQRFFPCDDVYEDGLHPWPVRITAPCLPNGRYSPCALARLTIEGDLDFTWKEGLRCATRNSLPDLIPDTSRFISLNGSSRRLRS